jgi:hypothetical protein
LQLEQWLEKQTLSNESRSCFEESFICYKVGAYKAALLFGYLGFLSTIRDRILQSRPPQGVLEKRWTEIQNKVSNHSFLSGRDLSRFLSETFETVNKQGRARYYLTGTISEPAQSLLSGLIKYGTPDVQDAAAKFITDDRKRCYEFLRSNVGLVYVVAKEPSLIRWVWNQAGRGDAPDYALISAMLRNKLIPTTETREALRAFILKAPSGRPSDDEREELKRHGFYDELRNAAVNDALMNDFKTANQCCSLLVDLLDCIDIDPSLAETIFHAFDSDRHPWHLQKALSEFFDANPGKRKEYRGAISGNAELGIPKHLTILGAD